MKRFFNFYHNTPSFDDTHIVESSERKITK